MEQPVPFGEVLEAIDKLSLEEQEKLPVAGSRLPVPEAGNLKPEPGNMKKRFSYKEKREFDLLEKEIADLNSEKEKISQKFADGDLPYEEMQKLSQRIGEISSLLDAKEMRWLELSEMVE